MITERQRQILNLIVSLYSRDHTPIGSKALLDSIHASSATIRNDMKVLEELGFIQKEHTSSGRIPSILGYKYFVDNVLTLEEFSQNDLFQIMKAFDGEFYRLSDLFETASRTLSSLTGLTSFVLNIPQREQQLISFELVMLDSHSVLAVVTLATGEVRTNQFIMPKSMTEADLQVFSDVVKERLVGKKVIDIHYSLRTEIPQVVQQYFKVVNDVLQLFDTVFSDLFNDKLISSGRQNIFDYTTENLSELYKMLSDDTRMVHEIRQATDNDEMRSVEFKKKDFLENLTIISQKFIIPYRGLGTLTVIGPVEMDYQRILSILDLVAKVLTMKLSDYYRYLDGNHYEIRK
ncbi:heat-inducible transcriptional repressor HrcA [Lactococcus nasutitermitis]|uniref:Heat-inducible transcription repressor HrcA n=1 Tax=Lactococcus nasutitermitis TaxID=1652957 RepID=A0ABV9JGQ4_9LACT|nr:heat-inducible transcriptional repressor HrcA [Lactococcus nasutitermitis]